MATEQELVQAYHDATDDYREELAAHHKAMGEISGRRYAAIVALSDKGRTHLEIADLVGLSVGHVSHLIARGRRRAKGRDIA